MRHLRFLPLFLFVFCLCPVAYAQDDDPIRIDSALVRLNVGVVDQRGRPITSLSRNDFTLYEDNVRQEILSFETNSAPFSVVMLLDMSGSTISFRQNIKLSASRFLDALAPHDRVAVVEFYSRIRTLNNFTTDRRRAAFSIQAANGRGDTDLYKAIEFALNLLSRENTKRKAIVVLTDGIDTAQQNLDRELIRDLSDEAVLSAIRPGENAALNRVLDIADRDGVIIYPLALPTGDPARLADPTPRQIAMFQAARERLQIMADRTGGTMNAIRRLEEMGRLYGEIAADLRTLYTIEYAPSNLTRDGNWRSINIRVSDPSLISRTRTGYFAK
jgi:VWFA-related protein